jgi:SAM-dependent methyltransferase
MVFKNKKQLINRLISPEDVVLDVGFWGQGVDHHQPNWPHGLLKARAKDVYGVDTEFDEGAVSPRDHYQKTTAEKADFQVKFDVIFCGDVIEHLPNPGLFLDACKSMLSQGGRIILTTPNCFNLFNMFEKLGKREPTVNYDHVAYYNSKTLARLLEKMGYSSSGVDYLYSLETTHKESWKKKAQNVLYGFLALFTDKFIETLVVTARIASVKS